MFRPARAPVDLLDVGNWWSYTPGATWERPEGPGSDTYTRGRHPVTQVAHEDAAAYAAWAGKELPTETEWEYAARGGLDGAAFAWGDEFDPARANTYCLRYRPAARQFEAVDTSTTHIGFRCVVRDG